MAIKVRVGHYASLILTLYNQKTGAEIPATWSNIELTSNDVSLFKIEDVGNDTILDFVGVNEGFSGSAHVKATANYEDSNGKPATATLETDEMVVVEFPAADPVEVVMSATADQPLP